MKGSVLSDKHWSQLADREHIRLSDKARTGGGVRYVRRAKTTNKNAARASVLSQFSGSIYPQGISLLTMPSLGWNFERQLFHQRERNGKIRRTYIYSLERDEEVFRAAMEMMPGSEEGIFVKEAPAFATAAVRTLKIRAFWRCEFEEFALHNTQRFTGAWLDFCGPLSIRRLAGLKQFWDCVGDRLVITLMAGRYPAALVESVRNAGSVWELVHSSLPGAVLENAFVYRDSVPMCQFSLCRHERRKPE